MPEQTQSSCIAAVVECNADKLSVFCQLLLVMSLAETAMSPNCGDDAGFTTYMVPMGHGREDEKRLQLLSAERC